MGKGRKAGSANYQNDKLLDIVADIQPASLKEWRKVAAQYMKDSGEEEERDPKDLRAHFTKKLCSMGKKPTGNAELDRTAATANWIHESSAAKEGARMLQADTSDSEDENFVPVERRLFQAHSPSASSRDEMNCVETREHNTSFSFPIASPLRPRQSPVKKLSPLRASLLKKRKNEEEDVDNKSKSSRPTNPRTNAAGALSNLATALSTNAAAAQQQQLAQAQAAQQAQMMQMQSQMMMSMMSMMTMVMSRAAPSPAQVTAQAPVSAPSPSPKKKE